MKNSFSLRIAAAIASVGAALVLSQAVALLGLPVTGASASIALDADAGTTG